MSSQSFQLQKIAFLGPEGETEIRLSSGINVVCGASETGKSYLAEAVDFMLGGSSLREIPESTKYSQAAIDISFGNGEEWQIVRSVSGGNFELENKLIAESEPLKLKKKHVHEKIDNLSGFLLERLGFLGKRVLKNGKTGKTVSFSFRYLAHLIIIQDEEIQQKGSPFWGGQYVTKNEELASVKLLLTGIDDSKIVHIEGPDPSSSGQLVLIDEMLSDLHGEIADIGEEQDELKTRLGRLQSAITEQKSYLKGTQGRLNEVLELRKALFNQIRVYQDRLDEITDLLARFELLDGHYLVDIQRLLAIQESGSMFAHIELIPCPMCGAEPKSRHLVESCEGDVQGVVTAASAEILKIKTLQRELVDTRSDLQLETLVVKKTLTDKQNKFKEHNNYIQEQLVPKLSVAQSTFEALIEKRSEAQKTQSIYSRIDSLEDRKERLEDEVSGSEGKTKIASGLSDSIAHAFSKTVSSILKAWNFPGECSVHYDKDALDFVIDGKKRGSRGRGLRAITHAAVTIGLLEYCQENNLPHPGFVLLDSPLLAYFEPEEDEEQLLKGTDLKERFYNYLIEKHSSQNQILIVENLHPPESVVEKIHLNVFTRNPDKGRYGFL